MKDKEEKVGEALAIKIAKMAEDIYHKHLAEIISQELVDGVEGLSTFIDKALALNVALNQIAVERILDLVNNLPDRMFRKNDKSALFTSVIRSNLRKYEQLRERAVASDLWEFKDGKLTAFLVTGDASKVVK